MGWALYEESSYYSPGDIFWGRELIGEELLKAERGNPSKGLLEGMHFSYVCILIP